MKLAIRIAMVSGLGVEAIYMNAGLKEREKAWFIFALAVPFLQTLVVPFLRPFFRTSRRRKLVLAQAGGTRKQKRRLDAAATTPAETSRFGGAMPLFTPFFLVATAEWLAKLRA